MEDQPSFAQAEYARKKKVTRWDQFLTQMEQVVPWARLVKLIEPRYPRGQRGRPSVGMERMLRLYFLQQWYGLADEALEDTVYDSQASVEGTAANVSDISQAHALLHGEESVVHAYASYIGVEKRAENLEKHARVEWRIAQKRGKLKALPESWIKDLTLGYEKLKASVRARVEHPFHGIKNLFKHRKVRYRGLQKNTAQLHSLFALANLVMVRKHLLVAQ